MKVETRNSFINGEKSVENWFRSANSNTRGKTKDTGKKGVLYAFRLEEVSRQPGQPNEEIFKEY
jgi:hypothetical protein